MKVINLWAGPGSGKSTTAAGLFFLLKNAGHNVELVTEYAKQLVWQERQATFSDQLYILGKQNHKLHALKDKVEFAVTDSPLLLSSVYAPKKFINGFHGFTLNLFKSYTNLNFFIRRVKPYNPIGRNQDESGAKDLDAVILSFLEENNIPYVRVDGDANAPQKILDLVLTNS